MIYELTNNTLPAAALFGDWEETLIWSCLQGIMGSVYADDLNSPTAAMAVIGDFTFFAGKPNLELVSHKPGRCKQDFMIMVPQTEPWKDMIVRFYGERQKSFPATPSKRSRTFLTAGSWKRPLPPCRKALPSP